MRYLPRARLRATALVAAVIALVGAGLAYAQIPGPDGVIHGCYLKSGGNLRVIDSAGKCKTTETTLNWNQRGVTGPTGARGPSGTNGTDGATGPTGPSGISLFANVRSDGTLLSGTAISVEKTSTPRYHVKFDRDISNCAATAEVGSTGTPVDYAPGAATTVQTGLVGNDTARVTIWESSSSAISSDFKLIVVC